jgi:Flp pilus assembly pilin Flp
MSGNSATARAEEQRLTGDCGGNLVEYALLIALIFLVALTAVRVFANNASSKFNCASSTVASSVAGATC